MTIASRDLRARFRRGPSAGSTHEVSHWENNYGGAVKALNAIEQRLDAMGREKGLVVRGGAPGLAVEVVDTGPASPTDHRERIFDRFYRVDQAAPIASVGPASDSPSLAGQSRPMASASSWTALTVTGARSGSPCHSRRAQAANRV